MILVQDGGLHSISPVPCLKNGHVSSNLEATDINHSSGELEPANCKEYFPSRSVDRNCLRVLFVHHTIDCSRVLRVNATHLLYVYQQ